MARRRRRPPPRHGAAREPAARGGGARAPPDRWPSRIAGGLLATNGIGKPFGHPLFHPIYAAAEELGLPIAIHAAGESFASTRVSLVGSGVAWIPAVLWRFDMDFRGLRREAPWLRRAPSEYFYEHVRVTTQPLEIAPSRSHMHQLLKLVSAEEILCFSSDYPHWDTDEVSDIGRNIPEARHRKVFHDNAMELFGWNGG